MKRANEPSLAQQEEEALVRVRRAARDLKEALAAAARDVVTAHPWALPSAGFCAGLAAPFLIPDRSAAREPHPRFANDEWGARETIGDEARAIAVSAIAQAFVVLARRLVAGDGNGCCNLEYDHEDG